MPLRWGASERAFLQKIEDVDRADEMTELKKHIETLSVSIREESTQWRERVKQLESKVSQHRKMTKDNVRRREIASAEQTVKLHQRSDRVCRSIHGAGTQGER